MPGVPDFYQGTEIWDDSMVDPDNRRPVDYERRRQMLSALAGARPAELLENWPDGRIKLLATTRLLHFRREHPGLFCSGSYEALTASGSHADSVVAYARRHEGKTLIVVTPRLSSRVGFPPVGERWLETAVELPPDLAGATWRDLHTGRVFQQDGAQLVLAEALADFPFAALATQ